MAEIIKSTLTGAKLLCTFKSEEAFELKCSDNFMLFEDFTYTAMETADLENETISRIEFAESQGGMCLNYTYNNITRSISLSSKYGKYLQEVITMALFEHSMLKDEEDV